MRLAILGFAFGVWTLQQEASLPGWALVVALVAVAAIAIALRRTIRPPPSAATAALVLVTSMVLGYAWAAGAAKLRLADRLDPAWEGRDVTLTGVIASLPQPFERGVRFELDVESAADSGGRAFDAPGRVLVSWYNGLTREEFQEVLPVRAGERWRLTVRLRRPHGNANPHGFDY
jgi:competence protein ComEC